MKGFWGRGEERSRRKCLGFGWSDLGEQAEWDNGLKKRTWRRGDVREKVWEDLGCRVWSLGFQGFKVLGTTSNHGELGDLERKEFRGNA